MSKERVVLYLGLTPPPKKKGVRFIHYPVIRIVPRPSADPIVSDAFSQYSKATHLVFTSKSAVDIFFSMTKEFSIKLEQVLALPAVVVGTATAGKLESYGHFKLLVASEERAEGVAALIEDLEDLKECCFFWPHSRLARPYLSEFFDRQGIHWIDCPIYDTVIHQQLPLPELSGIDEIVFTSPSTVSAFIELFGSLPSSPFLTLNTLGEVTAAALRSSRI